MLNSSRSALLPHFKRVGLPRLQIYSEFNPALIAAAAFDRC
eukprot:SAG22_NODE_10031_length_557_cov_0.834061_1_plen_40_part_10